MTIIFNDHPVPSKLGPPLRLEGNGMRWPFIVVMILIFEDLINRDILKLPLLPEGCPIGRGGF